MGESTESLIEQLVRLSPTKGYWSVLTSTDKVELYGITDLQGQVIAEEIDMKDGEGGYFTFLQFTKQDDLALIALASVMRDYILNMQNGAKS